MCSKTESSTVSNYVENVLKINPTATPASSQITAIILAIRQRKSWNDIMTTTKNLTVVALYRAKRKNKEKQ